MSDVAIRPVTPDQHDAVMHYFDMVAYADNPNWSKCFCMEKLVEHLRARGMKTAEAYPWLGEVDPARWVWSQYVGPLSLYVKAGFEIAEKLDEFCIVRRKL